MEGTVDENRGFRSFSAKKGRRSLRGKLLPLLLSGGFGGEPIGLFVDEPQGGKPQEEVEEPDDLEEKGFCVNMRLIHKVVLLHLSLAAM